LLQYEKKGMVLQGCFLFIFGPGLASLITPNIMEQASIWCFFSIAQILVMLFLIRETLIRVWGRADTHSLTTKNVPQLHPKSKTHTDNATKARKSS
jgi:hypothetical protein